MDRRPPHQTSPPSPTTALLFQNERKARHMSAPLPSIQQTRSAPAPERSLSTNEKRARHVSLQSMVDSITKEAVPYFQDEDDSTIQVPGYNPNSNRNSDMSQLIDHNLPGYQQSIDPYIPSGENDGFDRNGRHPEDMEGSIAPPGAPPAFPEMSRWRETLFVAMCASSHLMTQAALGQALAPMDLIAQQFGTVSKGPVSEGQKSWFIAAYSLTVGTFIMISGRLGDIFGHKKVLVLGYGWLGIWSLFAGFSGYTHSQIFFDVCRAMQGIGPALLMPNALGLFGRAYQGKKKVIVMSIFGALAPTGFVIGAVFGSLFAQLVSWQWAFWSYGITALVLGALSLIIIPKALSSSPEKRPTFDWAGSFLVVAGLVLVNVAFNNAPLYGWGTPHVYFVLIIGVLTLGVFIWAEHRAEHPLLPIRAMDRTVGFVLALVGVGWGSFGVWVFYNIRFLQHVRHESPLTVSAHYVPAAVSGFIAAGLTALLLTHTPVSFVMMMSMVAFCTGIVIATFQPAQQTYWAQTFFSILIMPFGMDMSFPAATVILSNHMPHEHQGLAQSLVNTVVNYSISIALGIAGTVEKYAPNDDRVQQNRNALYSALGLSGFGVLLGAMFFAYSLRREGWVVMAH